MVGALGRQMPAADEFCRVLLTSAPIDEVTRYNVSVEMTLYAAEFVRAGAAALPPARGEMGLLFNIADELNYDALIIRYSVNGLVAKRIVSV